MKTIRKDNGQYRNPFFLKLLNHADEIIHFMMHGGIRLQDILLSLATLYIKEYTKRISSFRKQLSHYNYLIIKDIKRYDLGSHGDRGFRCPACNFSIQCRGLYPSC